MINLDKLLVPLFVAIIALYSSSDKVLSNFKHHDDRGVNKSNNLDYWIGGILDSQMRYDWGQGNEKDYWDVVDIGQ